MSQAVATIATERVTSADGTVIAFERVGSGPALVLVDGALCYRDFGPARPLAGALSPSFTVYTWDRRGRGESGDTAPYAVEREIEDLRAVIAAAGGQAFVVGQSSGASLALAASAHGVPMRGLAVYEPPFVGQRRVKGRTVDYLATLRATLARGDRAGAVSYFLVKMVGAPAFVPLMMRLMPRVWSKLKGVAHTLPYDASIMGDFEVPTAELAKLRVPTLVLAGGKSPAPMREGVTRAAEAIPGSTHRILDGQTHQVSEKALAPEIIGFFATAG
ncbi:alpha/beta fold hydrolase [Lacisediminihabitans sp.]|uniref:alpha/beta fold hydrolase n=1 Tax=Lacisediminihabitans sp. TaxID=2787631 RepID=UPI00374CD6A7